MKMTIFLDIDGCVLEHKTCLTTIHDDWGSVLPNVYTKFNEWASKGYKIILTSGRPESMRKYTEKQLTKLGLFYDQLIMGLTNAPRILINDKKPNMNTTAKAYNLDRDAGLGEIEE